MALVSPRVLPGISKIKEHTVVFDNGDEHQFDAIIFAIGYKNVVTKWLKDYSSIFIEDGTFINWKGENGLYCAGFLKRRIAGISMDAIAIANDITLQEKYHPVYVVITTLTRVGGASFWQLAKFHHAGAIAYPNALAPDLTAGFSLSFLACYAPTSGMLYQMRQPISGVGATCANSN
ncbi:hypothetical protein KY290_036743 [Solanum tuberosum]|uniref:indole-3-pyruvate monooxygenase n=1 Tax=Solanum tuberosum TaxID=4113 RepID=A0ABQ7TV49_SOLTU|nr:hypothetical protein KY285_036059 [Solanum tuberosum]KAH0738038.1 hypothetical protein KY290_036743 [Solanum tuberosum]